MFLFRIGAEIVDVESVEIVTDAFAHVDALIFQLSLHYAWVEKFIGVFLYCFDEEELDTIFCTWCYFSIQPETDTGEDESEKKYGCCDTWE